MHNAMSNKSPAMPVKADDSAKSFLDGASEQLTELILKRGYDNTPMSVIAKTLGMTKAGIYHHIETKEDLLYAVHRRAIDQMLLPVIERADLVPEPEAKLRLFLFEYAHLMTRDPAARVLINEAHRLSPERFEEIRGVWRRGYRLVPRCRKPAAAGTTSTPVMPHSPRSACAAGFSIGSTTRGRLPATRSPRRCATFSCRAS
jgi:AcrR family transcriptional regulator